MTGGAAASGTPETTQTHGANACVVHHRNKQCLGHLLYLHGSGTVMLVHEGPLQVQSPCFLHHLPA